jgi:ribosomal-protein-alanine N-acetyltransferase
MATSTIALARRQDATLLAAMSRRLIETGLEHQWTESRIERARQHEDYVVLTARFGARLAGFAIMQYGDDAAHLNLLAVEPSYQRQGIGRQLMRWLEDTASTAGTFRIRLEVRASNQTGQAFYKAIGYQQSDWLRGYYQAHEDALRLERNLALIRSVGPTE